MPYSIGALDVTASLREQVNEFVAALLEPAPVVATDPPAPVVATHAPAPDPAEALVAAITAGYWRRSTVPPETRADIAAKVDNRLRLGAPIEFTVPFGGYKAPDQPGAPDLNWAEVMWLAHLRRYAATVSALHRHGVVVTLTYYSAALDLINNLPLEQQAHYIGQLRQVAQWFSDDRVRFEVFDLVELHGGAHAFRAELQQAIAAGAHAEPSPAQLASARRNLVTSLPTADPEFDRAAAASARACLAMESLPPRRRFNKGEHRIQIGHIRGPALSLHLGSTRTSTMQPWVATGALRAHGEGLIECLGRGPLTGTAFEVDHPLVQVSPQLRSIVVVER